MRSGLRVCACYMMLCGAINHGHRDKLASKVSESRAPVDDHVHHSAQPNASGLPFYGCGPALRAPARTKHVRSASGYG